MAFILETNCHIQSSNTYTNIYISHISVMKNEEIWKYLTKTDDASVQCCFCGRIFICTIKPEHHLRHLLENHIYEKETEVKGTKLNSDLKLRTLLGREKKDKKYVCSHCSKRFHFRQRKDMCEARHSRLKCTYDGCSMTASTLQVMDKHISAVHKKLKPHICDQCGKAFNQRDQMKTHSRVHTGETPFGCEKCHKKFKFHATRNSHKCASS